MHWPSILTLSVCSVLGLANDQQNIEKGRLAQINSKYPLQVNIQIDPLSDEQSRAGITINDLKQIITQQLENSAITINEDLSDRLLHLKMGTIEINSDRVSFIQLNLLEPALLLRNRSTFNAITWTQAYLFSCKSEDFKSETYASVLKMTKLFSQEYQRAFSPTP